MRLKLSWSWIAVGLLIGITYRMAGDRPEDGGILGFAEAGTGMALTLFGLLVVVHMVSAVIGPTTDQALACRSRSLFSVAIGLLSALAALVWL